MLNKIKDKFIHILRKNCGYYELEHDLKFQLKTNDIILKSKISLLKEKIEFKNIELYKLSSQHETKILEYDILKHQFKEVIDMITNNSTMPEIVNLELISKCYEYKNNYNYKKYLVAELEEILKIMKEKGIHPQDLIKRIINKANRDLKE